MSEALSNRDEIFLTMKQAGKPLTRGEIVEATRIPRSTVYDNLVALMGNGAVEKEKDKKTPGPGRACITWRTLT